MAGGAPPFQLVAGDKYNFTLGMVFVCGLAVFKDLNRLPPLVRWNLTAYTNWNLSLIALRLLLQQSQWDPFLCVNSMGVLVGFRTGFSQGLDENMRKKLRRLGLPLSRWLFFLGDHICHTLPVLVLAGVLARQRKKVSYVHSAYGMTLATWFAFRQQAKLDSSSIYVPHPWRRTWVGIMVGMLATPRLVDALGERRWRALAGTLALLLLPWLSTRLDPNIKKTYQLEFAISSVESPREQEEKPRASKPRMSRVASQPAYASSSLR